LFALYTFRVTLVAGVGAHTADASATAMVGTVVPNLILAVLMTALI
jgi:hypothetical protein